jgi:hypothetical protein
MSKSVNWGNNTYGTGATQVTYNPQTPQQYQEGRQATGFYRGDKESRRNTYGNTQYKGPGSGKSTSGFDSNYGGKRNNKSKRNNKTKRHNKSKKHNKSKRHH